MTPRPTLPVRLSFAGIVGGAFVVRGLRSLELAEARDRFPDDLPEQLKTQRLGPELVALALCDEQGERIFVDGAAVGELDTDDARELVAEVGKALGTISPLHGVSDVAAWHAALVTGAREAPTTAMALGSCVADAGRNVVPRPDRYFGLPLGELTDGQWMAFRAARAVHNEIVNR